VLIRRARHDQVMHYLVKFWLVEVGNNDTPARNAGKRITKESDFLDKTRVS